MQQERDTVERERAGERASERERYSIHIAREGEDKKRKP
jgi:hypothetical protein